MDIPITKDGVLFTLAIYGAALSTWNLISALRKESRAVRVTAGSKIPVIHGTDTGETWAHIEVTNIGQRPVTITMIAFELESGGRLFNMHGRPAHRGMEDTTLPVTLTDGQTARLHQAYADIGQALRANSPEKKKRKITPICEDSTGGIHRGAAWDVDVNEFLRM